MRLSRIGAAVLLAFGMSRSALAQEVRHAKTIEDAVAIAKKEGLDILVDFTGSDWCGWCVRLDKEVFSRDEWKQAAAGKYLFVTLDFPQKKSLPEPEKAYNEKARDRFGVQGFPTIVLLDREGLPYARTGYQEGGPEGYLKHLEGLAQHKEEIRKSRLEAKTGDSGARVKLLSSLMAKLAEWGIDSGYPDLKSSLIELDPKNEGGHRLKYARELAIQSYRSGEKEQFAKYVGMVKDLDPEAAAGIEAAIAIESGVMPLLQKGEWQQGLDAMKPMMETVTRGEDAQNLRYFSAVCEFRLGNKDRATELLQQALDCAPASKAAEQIRATLEQVKGR